ncbi:MAG: M16 family metallopeptidase [Gemmatimonas sp.]
MNLLKPFRPLLLGIAAAVTPLLLDVVPADAAVSVKRVVSPMGIEAWLVQDRTVPVFALQFAFKGGSALDPAGKEGLAELTVDLLDEGAGDMDSQDFHGAVQDLGAQLSFSAGLDNLQGGVFVHSDRRDEAMRLLSVALTEPRFADEAIARVKAQIVADLSRAQENPRRLVRETFSKVLFADHPYSRRTEGTIPGIQAITRDDLVGLAKSRLTRDHLVVTVVGDIEEQALGALLDRTFGQLPATGGSVDVAEATIHDNGQVVVIDKDIPQSTVNFGQEGPRRDDPDIYAMLVMNYILGGGGFSSRLTNEVRDKRGLAYSVGSSLAAYDHAGMIVGSVGTENQRVGESLDLIREEWAKMRDKGATANEVKDAKSFLTGSYLTGIGSSSALAGVLLSYRLDGRPIDYLETRNGLIEKVTLADVNRVAKKWLKPDALVFVVVGRPKGVEATMPAPPIEGASR